MSDVVMYEGKTDANSNPRAYQHGLALSQCQCGGYHFSIESVLSVR